MSFKNILIIGASSGLGKDLAELFLELQDIQLGIFSRKKPILKRAFDFYQMDVTRTNEVLETVSNLEQGLKFDMVIYCPSKWGEKEILNSPELQEFLAAGPLGFLELINCLTEFNKLKSKANIISIGSTATLLASSEIIKDSSPKYSIAKQIQKNITLELQKQYLNTNLKFTTLTLGKLGQDEVSSLDIFKTVQTLSNLSKNCLPLEIKLVSKADFRDR